MMQLALASFHGDYLGVVQAVDRVIFRYICTCLCLCWRCFAAILCSFYVSGMLSHAFCIHRRVYQLTSDAKIKFAAVASKDMPDSCDECGEPATEMRQHESDMASIVCEWVSKFISIIEENDMLEDLDDYICKKDSDSESETEDRLCETQSPSETESDMDSDSESSSQK